MAAADERIEHVRAYLEYFRDMGVHEFYRTDTPDGVEAAVEIETESAVEMLVETLPVVAQEVTLAPAELNIVKLVSFNDLAPLPVGPRGSGAAGGSARGHSEKYWRLHAMSAGVCGAAYDRVRRWGSKCAADVCGRRAGRG